MTNLVDNCCTVEALSRLKGITVAHWNSRSLYPKFDEVTVWMDESDLECLVISESWLTQDIPSDFVHLDGYNMFRHDRDASTGKSRGGGLVCYVKSRFNSLHLENMNVCTANVEMMVVKIKLTNTRDWYIIGVYRPPNGNVKHFCDAVEECVNNLRVKTPVEITLVGDMNINVEKSREKPVKMYLDLLKRLGLTNLIKTYTHFNSHTLNNSIIDHFVTSDPELYQVHGTCPVSCSDHFIIYGCRKKNKAKAQKKPSMLELTLNLMLRNFWLMLIELTGILYLLVVILILHGKCSRFYSCNY